MKKIQTITDKVSTKLLGAGLFFMAVLTPGSVNAQFGPPTEVEPEGVEGDLMSIFQTVANILLFLIGAVAVIMLIIGGFRYVASGGDSNAVEGAKNTILYAIIGIVVAFLAYAAVNFVIDQLQP